MRIPNEPGGVYCQADTVNQQRRYDVIHPDRTLELTRDEMRSIVDEAARRVIDHIESLPSQPSYDTEGGAALARSVIEPLPREGRPVGELLDLLFDRLVPKSFNTASPGYLAYVPGGGLVHSAVADFIADSVNRYVGVWAAAPALAQLESNVIRWFCDIVGFPSEARGVLTSGGSLANLFAIVAARKQRLPEDFLRGTIYTSDQAHHSVPKAAATAGFPRDSMRLIETDDVKRVRVAAMADRIAADRRAGLHPFLIVGHAGTTNTGAVDDLDALAELARREGLWFHIDAAYGGFFMLTERGRSRMKGIDRADSVVLDPHKGLFLPYGTGCLLVRDGETLRQAFAQSAAYMPGYQQDPDFVDFCEYSPELSRDFRGLRVWLPIKMHGIEPFRRNLEEKLQLAEWAAEELRRIHGIEIVAEPQLSILAFRFAPPGHSPESLDDLNRDLLSRINARRRVYLTGTQLDGRFVIRICVLSFRTHLDRMRMCIEDIKAAVRDKLGTIPHA